MSASRFQYYTSFFSDQYQTAKSKVFSVLDAPSVKQASQVLAKQYEEAKTSIYNLYDQGYHNPEALAGIKDKLVAMTTTEPVLQTREVIEGGLKATLGVNYIFDLGLKCIPVTSSLFTAVELMKYACLGFTFVMASYKTYDDLASKKTIRENIDALSEEINFADQTFHQTKKLLMDNKLVARTVDVDYTKLKVTVAEPLQPDFMKKSSVSTAFLMIQSVLDGAVKSMGYLFIANLMHELLLPTLHKNLQKQFLFWIILSINTSAAFLRNETLQSEQVKLSNLEKKIPAAYEKLIEIERSIGTKETLEAMLQEKKEDVPSYQMEEIRSKISVLAEEEPMIYLTALIHGATLAAGVSFIFDQALPQMKAAKYFAGLSTLMTGAMEAYFKNKENIDFQKKIQKLSEKNQEVQDILMIANKLGEGASSPSFFKEKNSENVQIEVQKSIASFP